MARGHGSNWFIGDRDNDIDAADLNRYLVLMGLAAYLDRQEFESVLSAVEPKDKDFRAAIESLIELRANRERQSA